MKRNNFKDIFTCSQNCYITKQTRKKKLYRRRSMSTQKKKINIPKKVWLHGEQREKNCYTSLVSFFVYTNFLLNLSTSDIFVVVVELFRLFNNTFNRITWIINRRCGKKTVRFKCTQFFLSVFSARRSRNAKYKRFSNEFAEK